jgi:hypothetical protein
MKPDYQEFEGRRIEIRERQGRYELLVDDVPVPYGRLPTGKFFLDDYAYDWQDDLMELARRYVIYRRRVAAIKTGKPERGQ